MYLKIKFILQGFGNFLLTLYQRRFLIFEMAKRDISDQYVDSLLGFIWTFVNPLMIIFIFWLVFSVGLKINPKNNVPFIVWFTAGMAIWNTFSEIINGSTGVIIANPHLVKKIIFPLSILPVSKLVASFVTHVIFLFVLVLLIMLFKIPSSVYWLQAFYYFFAMSILALGLSWMTSSITIFIKDTSQIVNLLLMFGFYCTPVFWDAGVMPTKVAFFLKLNPMFYIVQGYRESFLYDIPFWRHWQMTLYFWGVTAVIFALGSAIFLKLRPHFADVL